MILTVTLNPAVDLSVFGGPFSPHRTNRGDAMAPEPGGKGNNAARTARLLGAGVTATGILGGFTGAYIEEGLSRDGVAAEFFHTEAPTRITVAWVEEETGLETKIVPGGPIICPEEGRDFLRHFEGLVKTGSYSIICLCGSLPRGLPDDYYADMIRLAARYNVPVFLDTSGAALREGIEAGPMAVKPNEVEAAELAGSGERDRIAKYMEGLGSRVPYVFLTMGAAGAWCFHGSTRAVVRSEAEKGVNPVGAGDAFVGGFAAAWDLYGDDAARLPAWAAAAGTSAALSRGILFEREVFDRVLAALKVEAME